MHDIFSDYLFDESQATRERALTARSNKNIEHSLKDANTNSELATYGDALLKLAFCKILFDDEKVKNITVTKQNYESDEVLVKIIARYYNLLEYIKYDKDDKNIPKDYEFSKPSYKSYKYIATTVEALIAAIYLDNKEDFSVVVDIARNWKELIDKIDKNKTAGGESGFTTIEGE